MFMKVICKRGGLKGNYSNHSGKRSCATQLYMAGIDEQEIMARTGHRSEKSVRKYKQSSTTIQQKVASVLDPPRVDSDTHMKSLKRDRDKESESIPENVLTERKKLRGENSTCPVFNNCNVTFYG